MATIVKRDDKWRVQVRRKGHKTLSKTFSKKILAEKWAREMETAVEEGRFHANDPDFGVVVQKYIDEVLPIKPMQRTHHATLRTLRRKVGGTLVSAVNAGLEDLRWHDLRHEGIPRLFEGGYGVEQVAIVSGHNDWGMLRRYTHLKPESLHRD